MIFTFNFYSFIFKYITYEHFYQINRDNIKAILDQSDNVISGNELLSEMLTSQIQVKNCNEPKQEKLKGRHKRESKNKKQETRNKTV